MHGIAALALSIVFSASVKFIIFYPLDITAHNTALVYSTHAVKSVYVAPTQSVRLFTC